MPCNGDGSFLIRTTETHNGRYCLSVLHHEKVVHYLIGSLDTGDLFLTSEVAFPTLRELVSHHKQQAHGLCCRLARPCSITELLHKSHASREIDRQETTILADQEIEREADREVNKQEMIHADLETNRQEISLVKVYEDGEFTVSWEGLWKNTTPVVVEIPKLDKISRTEFLKAIDTMKRLRHPKIVQLHATCTREDPFFAVVEHSMYGNLLNYLQNHEDHERRLAPSDPYLIDIAVQVAEGMAYMERRNCTHRRLMARNVEVGYRLNCKLSGFMAPNGRDTSSEAAVKWSAPEVVLQNTYSIKSDVWSFGVVLYEIVTYGGTPYPGLSDATVLSFLQSEWRMVRPMACDPKLYEIMLHCWKEEPDDRWTFEALARQLSDFFTIEKTDCY